MNPLNSIINDLRTRRLWPFALVLVLALVAVPVLLAKSSAPVPVPNVPPPAASNQPTLPIVSAETGVTRTHPSGTSRDPFAGGASTSASSTTTSTSKATSASSATSSTSSKSSTSGATSTTTTTTTTTTPIPPPPAGALAPGTLGASQTYEVALAISEPSGMLQTVDPVERLSILPSKQQPLLVELGVLKGGRRVLFAREPGASVSGAGACTPGPIDCQILSLAPGQDETLSQQTSSGTNEVAVFAITAIRAHEQPSAGAAFMARRHASPAGRALLAGSQSSVLSLFQYEPKLGAVVDLRDLSIGGNG